MVHDPQRFHEFMPDKVWKWKILEQKVEKVLGLHDYQEIRLSVLQDTKVLEAGVTALMQGTEAEHAMQSVMSLMQPEDNLSLLSLRPEGTISVLHHTARITNPGEIHRFYYSGPMFRRANELKQMEFYQLGVELLGSESILSENEVINLGMKICQELGLKEVRLDLNSYGCFECRKAFFADLRKYLDEHRDGYCATCYKELYANPFSETRCDSANCLHSLKNGPEIERYLCHTCKDNFTRVKKIQANLGNRYKVNSHLYKNFAYYNETVFDFVATYEGKEIMIGGGGRYDYLSAQITGKKIPAVGFYLNLDTIFEIIETRGFFQLKEPDFKVYICTESENLEMMTLQMAQELHNEGIKTIISPEISTTAAEIKRALAMGCSLMLIIRDDNIREGKILLRNLDKEHQDYVALKDTIPAIMLARKALKQE
ncbi:MAG: ATP phosphoribosyltransferase regulatory subunit [Candidatus Cloacimonas sp.]|jgi:histidyl-tRNA synthetase|nr:ATP phosphoribosyltransferase regulatory subunit [Candidatus Cloacimonas sp.]